MRVQARKNMIGWRVFATFPLHLFLLLAFVASDNLYAEAQNSEPVCYSGEYLIESSSVKALQAKSLEAFDAAVSGAVEVDIRTNHIQLVETSLADGKASEGSVIKESEAQKVCDRLKRLAREERREGLSDGRPDIVRRVECSCNAKLTALVNPNDTYYSLVWGLHQANNIDMNAPEAWELTTGSSSVIVAVVDTGINYAHPDLAANMWINTAETPGDGIDNDGNGVIDDRHGINAVSGNGNPNDDNGHGTHVAGTIGASGNNGAGIVGVNWNVKLMGAKFLGGDGSGSTAGAIVAIDYITMMKQRGHNIVMSNNSWGGGGYSSLLRDSIVRAQNAGILFVAAAGNGGSDGVGDNNDLSPSYPANYDCENIISVAAIDKNGAMASFSNYGVSTVDIGAPGVDIASTYLNNGYVWMSGTSMATPNVSGALALLAAYVPGARWQDLKSTLYSTGKPIASLVGKTATGKIPNLQALLSVGGGLPQSTPTPAPTSTSTPTPTPTATPTLTPTQTPTPQPGYWTISGTVSVQGTLIGGATVRIQTSSGSFVRKTNSSGQYRFDNILGPTPYTITTWSMGATFSNITGMLGSDTVIDIVGTERRYSISATVLNPAKTPISGVSVDGGELGVRTTNSAGQVVFEAPFYRQYRLQAQGNGTYIFNDPVRTGTVYGDQSRVFIGVAD